ncbi:MAG: SDR family oxidoreductase [Actinomycetota bacterium]|nr:SDR family oxidoreductase [Actinomycetota bacterium]
MSAPVVVITGASAGVGRATARAFARAGSHVGLIARDHEGLEAAAEEARGSGVRAVTALVDVADAEAIDRAAGVFEEELGPIDVWVNNAMTSVFSPVHELEAAEVKRVTEVTYLGSVNGILAALARMRPRNAGTIVQVGSALAYRGIPLQAAYCGSKHAIRGFVDSLRCELVHDRLGLKVTMVHLPAINTPQFGWVRNRLSHHPQPVPPIYQPEVAARAILWAATHPRREVHVGFPTVGTIWANKLVPGLLDRYLARTGYESQQLDVAREGERPEGDRPDNLWEPVPGDHGAHGIFDDQATSSSPQLCFTTHRRLAGGVAAAAAVVVVITARR